MSRTTFTNLLAMMPYNQVGGFIVSNQIHITHITHWTYVGVHLHVPQHTYHFKTVQSAVKCGPLFRVKLMTGMVTV